MEDFPYEDGVSFVNDERIKRGIFSYNRYHSMVKDGKIKYLVGKKGVQPDMFLGGKFEGYTSIFDQGKYQVFIYKTE